MRRKSELMCSWKYPLNILSFQEQWGQFGAFRFVSDYHLIYFSSTVFGYQWGEPSIDYPQVN
jgi:hypothetical protein